MIKGRLWHLKEVVINRIQAVKNELANKTVFLNLIVWFFRKHSFLLKYRRVQKVQNRFHSDAIFSIWYLSPFVGFGFSIRGGWEFDEMPLFILRLADDGKRKIIKSPKLSIMRFLYFFDFDKFS